MKMNPLSIFSSLVPSSRKYGLKLPQASGRDAYGMETHWNWHGRIGFEIQEIRK